MTKRIANFQGEVPRLSERLLSDNGAQAAVNCVLERGVLTPIRLPRLEKSYAGPIGSIFKHKGVWYTWPQEGVSAAPGPVATDRLYITGDGAPKLHAGGQDYPLALYPPEDGKVLTGTVVTDEEYVEVEGTQIQLKAGTTGTLASGLRYEVTVDDRKATIELTSATGVSASAMEAAVNSIRYSNNSDDPTDGTRVFALTAITGSGKTEDGDPNTTSLSKRSTVYVETENHHEGEEPDDDELEEDDGSSEFLLLDGTVIRPVVGNAGTTSSGYNYSVAAINGGIEVILTLPDITHSTLENLIEGLRYDCDADSLSDGVRTVTIAKLTDGGPSNTVSSYTMVSKVHIGVPGGDEESETGFFDASLMSNGFADPPMAEGTAINPSYVPGGPAVALFRAVSVSTGDDMDGAALGGFHYFREVRVQLTGADDAILSPPQLTVTAIHPSYARGDGPVAVYRDCKIVAGALGVTQTIQGLTFYVNNLANGALDPETTVAVQWAYTWVTEFDEESPPSDMDATSAMDWNPDLRVRLTGFLEPPPGRAINRQRIYRSQTSSLGETNLYFVYERPATSADFIYDPESADMALGESCPSINYDPPEDGLQGILSMANGIMAGFVGKNLYFSEPYIPHAWPADYMLSFDYDIVGLATFGQYVAVLTTGRPYIVGGLQPDSMSVTRTDMDAPCVSAKSIVDFAAGCLYASPQGLVMVGPSGVTLASQRYFTREQWQSMAPGAMVGGLFNGKYLGTYTVEQDGDFHTGMFIMDLTGGEAYLTRYSDTCDLMFNEIGTGTLYMLKDRRHIYEWDSRSKPYAEMVWRSKRFVDVQHLNYGAILIEGEDIISEKQRLLNRARIAANQQLISDGKTGGAMGDLALGLVPLGGSLLVPVNDQPPIFWCKVYADGVLIGTIDRMNVPVRLKSGFLAKQWEIEVGGSVRIDTISLGINPETLAQFAEG